MDIYIRAANGRSTTYTTQYLRTEARRIAKQYGQPMRSHRVECHENGNVRLVVQFDNASVGGAL